MLAVILLLQIVFRNMFLTLQHQCLAGDMQLFGVVNLCDEVCDFFGEFLFLRLRASLLDAEFLLTDDAVR